MSARSLNKVFLIGNLTRDPELRYTAQGTPIATFGLATNRSWMGPDGQRHEDVTFHRIVAWSKLGEICGKLLFKGRKVFIEGRLQNRKWVGADGQEREMAEVVAENMVILDNKRAEGRQEEDLLLEGGDGEIELTDVEVAGAEEKKEGENKEEKTESKGEEKKEKEEGQEEGGEEVVEIDEIPF